MNRYDGYRKSKYPLYKTVFRQAFETLGEAVKARDEVLKDLAEKRGY